MTKKFYESIDLKQNQILDANKVQLNQDASADDEAVRKLQAETISALAVQAKIVSTVAQNSAETFFSSEYTNTALNTKQPNMVIDPSSTSYLEIVDGYKIKLKDLGIVGTFKATNTSLTDFISDCVFNGDGTVTYNGTDTLDAMTFIFMENATLPQDRSVIYLGTNNGNTDDFVNFSVDYNTQEIRSYFSATGTGLVYDASTGIYSLDFGNAAGDLGAHTMPINGSLFNTVNGSTVLALLQSMEAYIATVATNSTNQGTQTEDRIDNICGSTGSGLGSFDGSTLPSDESVKTNLQTVENELEAATIDRAAIRSEFATADNTLSGQISAEATARFFAIQALTQSLASESTTRANADTSLTNSIASEALSRENADNALDARLDVIEGESNVVGSVAKAEADAISSSNSYTDAQVAAEQARAEAAEAALDLKVDNLQVGDIKFIGMVQASGALSLRPAQIAVESPTSRNGLDLADVYVNAGDVFVCEVDQTLVFGDGNLVLQDGDRLMAMIDRVAGLVSKDDFNVVQADSSALSVANVDDLRVTLNVNGNLDITANSIGRDQLDSAIEADIDDRQSLTTSNSITSPSDTHFYTSTDLSAQQNQYLKRTQVGTGALTGTVRTSLQELFINTDGSGNPLAPSYAHTTTMSAHYLGNCVDTSVVMAGGNFEANAKTGTAIQATGLYARADQDNLGLNVGATMIADNGSMSNVGCVAFSGAQGSGKDRGIVAVVSDQDILVYSGLRAADPFPFNDICVAADAKYAPAGTKAFYSYGDCKFDSGCVEVSDAPATDECVMRLADVKATEAVFEMNLTDGVAKTFACSLDLEKSIIQVVHSDDDVEVKVTRDNINNQLTVLALGGSLTGCRVIVSEMSCDVTTVA